MGSNPTLPASSSSGGSRGQPGTRTPPPTPRSAGAIGYNRICRVSPHLTWPCPGAAPPAAGTSRSLVTCTETDSPSRAETWLVVNCPDTRKPGPSEPVTTDWTTPSRHRKRTGVAGRAGGPHSGRDRRIVSRRTDRGRRRLCRGGPHARSVCGDSSGSAAGVYPIPG